MAPLAWLRQHDPNLAALRRAGRTAIVCPILLAVGTKVIGNGVVAEFAAFGSFAFLLLVDFGGRVRERLQAQTALALVGAVFICVGTLASRNVWLAVATTTILGFAVIFVGVVSSVLASASTSLLLALMLAVTLPGRASALPDRLEGWGLAAAASIVALVWLWPLPAGDPLRQALAASCRALATRLRREISYVTDEEDVSAAAGYHEAVSQAQKTVDALHRRFLASPYRPTSLSTGARTVVRLIDEVIWLEAVVDQCAPKGAWARGDPAASAVKLGVAGVLERGADVLSETRGDTAALHAALAELSATVTTLEQDAMGDLPVSGSAPVPVSTGQRAKEVLTSLDPRFRARELGFAVSLIGGNIELTAAADRRTWRERLMGRQPVGLSSTLSAAEERAGAHVERHSVWLRNSVRGAVALGLAIGVARATGVQHAFWVLFGALSVLRSNALSTGQHAARAVLGTTVGFAISAALLTGFDRSTTALWVLLPFAVLLAGVLPAAISFTAGQAAFTATNVILLNIVEPTGWRVGLVRVEDVALGAAVSLAVGLLFWPRGATAALRQAIADAYRASAAHLAGAVAFGMARCDLGAPVPPPSVGGADRAAAAARRLDDTFRNYLSERGTKSLGLADVTTLVNGVAGLHLAAGAVTDLWMGDDGTAPGDRGAARRELDGMTGAMTGWYDDLADGLSGSQDLPEPVAIDDRADQRLVDAVSSDLRGEDGRATATAVRVIWTGDHLDAVRRLQAVILPPARAANRLNRQPTLARRVRRRLGSGR